MKPKRSDEAVTEAVLDTYIEDFREMVKHWNASRVHGDVRGSLHSCVRMIRRGLYDKDSFRFDLTTNENAGLYLKFVSRTAEELARYVVETTVEEYKRFHEIEIDNVYETFCMLIMGLIGFMRRYPEAPDELIEALVAQTLRLDLGPVSPKGGDAHTQ